MSLCVGCKRRHERPSPHADQCREYYEVLIKPLRFVAERCGYALAVHGSLNYDIDLIACPWRDSAVGPEYLAEVIRSTAEAIVGTCYIHQYDRVPEKKPCGRLAWSFYMDAAKERQGPYIDLSIMPRLRK